jgi:D-alanyl-D-alanine carboxypeptidase-like protein
MVPVLFAALLLSGSAPAFIAHVGPVSASDLRWSWRAGCPVAPSRLRLIRLSFFGFDGKAHTGSLVVNATVADSVTTIFRRLYAKRFPIRKMQPIDAFRGRDEASLAADNTAGFNCRYAVAPGPHRWSVHAYGEAIDVNPVENPYLVSGSVHPSAGKAYLDRSRVRRGMALSGGQLVEAFGASGWQWGGRWTGSPDYQHFSSTGG